MCDRRHGAGRGRGRAAARGAERRPARRASRPARPELSPDGGAGDATAGRQHRGRDPQPSDAARARAARSRAAGGELQGRAVLRRTGHAPQRGGGVRVGAAARRERVSRAARHLPQHAPGQHRAAAGLRRNTLPASTSALRAGRRASWRANSRAKAGTRCRPIRWSSSAATRAACGKSWSRAPSGDRPTLTPDPK